MKQPERPFKQQGIDNPPGQFAVQPGSVLRVLSKLQVGQGSPFMKSLQDGYMLDEIVLVPRLKQITLPSTAQKDSKPRIEHSETLLRGVDK